MGGTFNPQILVEKLAKLNSSQQSIETLSHWCIFHMNKAKQVVETWAKQFHCSPRDQRLAFLYLANDILQNSRRKGSEFVGEFWKVLPDALRDVINNRDEVGKNAALRLVKIWEERKVFGSRGQILKEEIVGRHLETSNKNEKHSGLKLKQSAGTALDKIVSGYQGVYGGQLDKIVSGYQSVYGSQLDEDVVMSKCKNAISCVEKADKEIGGGIGSEKLAQGNGLDIVEDLKGQRATLKDCIEQLSAVESSRTNLVSYLREALQEQEMKLDQVRHQLQAAHAQSEKAENFCRQLLNPSGYKLLPEHGTKETHSSKTHSYVPSTIEQSAPVMYTRQIPPVAEQSEEDTKSAAAAVAAKLTASTSSAEMLTYVLSSLASEGVIGSSRKESPPEKRAKIENNQPPIPPFPHPDTANEQQPPPPSSPPPLPPMPPMQAYPVSPFMQTAGAVPHGFSANQQLRPPLPLPLPLPLPGYPGVSPQVASYMAAPPPNGYQNYQVYGRPPSMPMAPMSRQ